MYVWQILRIVTQLARLKGITRLPTRVHWIITELLILEQPRKYINAEAIDAPVEPEAQHIIHRLAHAWIAPVQIGLFHIEYVQVILSSLLVKLPGRTAEIAQPVIGRTTTRSRVSPDVPVTFFVCAVRTS